MHDDFLNMDKEKLVQVIMHKSFVIFIFFFVALIIGLPIYLYINQFGFGVWSNHNDWGVMGSFFGGVIGPIITTISLLFLAVQIRIQTKQRKEEALLHVCSECELDINKYIPRIVIFMSENDTRDKLKSILAQNKNLVNNGHVDDALRMVKEYIAQELGIWSMWFHIDASLRTLQKSKIYKFKRMRTLIFSEIEIEDITYLEGIRMALNKNKIETCFFPD